MTLFMLAVLVGLGSWQLHRLAWKEVLLARIAAAERAPAAPLAENPAPFAKVRLSGRWRPDLSAWYGVEVRDTPNGPRMGAQLVEPLERADAAPVLVDRGWAPTEGAAAMGSADGAATVEGFVLPAANPGWFTPKDDIAARRFYTLDPRAIGAALRLPRVAPFTVVAMGPASQSYPEPAQHLPRPPNNHLSYAMIWFGLAGALVWIFLDWSWQALSK